MRNQTAFSKHFCKLKNMGLAPEIQWRLLIRFTTPSCFDGRCKLCQEEKIQVMLYFDPDNLLNHICDLIARCRHKNRFRLFCSGADKHVDSANELSLMRVSDSQRQ